MSERIHVYEGKIYRIRDVFEPDGDGIRLVTCQFATVDEQGLVAWYDCSEGPEFKDIKPFGYTERVKSIVTIPHPDIIVRIDTNMGSVEVDDANSTVFDSIMGSQGFLDYCTKIAAATPAYQGKLPKASIKDYLDELYGFKPKQGT